MAHLKLTDATKLPCADGTYRRRLHSGTSVVITYRDSPAYVQGRQRWLDYQRDVLFARLHQKTDARRPIGDAYDDLGRARQRAATASSGSTTRPSGSRACARMTLPTSASAIRRATACRLADSGECLLQLVGEFLRAVNGQHVVGADHQMRMNVRYQLLRPVKRSSRPAAVDDLSVPDHDGRRRAYPPQRVVR